MLKLLISAASELSSTIRRDDVSHSPEKSFFAQNKAVQSNIYIPFEEVLHRVNHDVVNFVGSRLHDDFGRRQNSIDFKHHLGVHKFIAELLKVAGGEAHEGREHLLLPARVVEAHLVRLAGERAENQRLQLDHDGSNRVVKFLDFIRLLVPLQLETLKIFQARLYAVITVNDTNALLPRPRIIQIVGRLAQFTQF